VRHLVVGDVTRVRQVLVNLLSNSVKFTARGEVVVTVDAEESTPDFVELVFSVRDTGIGICQDDQQFIFDEFFQVDVATSQTYSGAGLGLALVKDLIALLDGEIAVTSDVGRGTSVAFKIPVQVIG